MMPHTHTHPCHVRDAAPLGPFGTCVDFMLKGDFFGCLFSHPTVAKTFQERKTLNTAAPNSDILEDINLLADRITRLWKQPIRNSANLLQSNAKNLYEKRQKDQHA